MDIDIDKLVDAVTREIMRRLNEGDAAGGCNPAKVVTFGDVPSGMIPAGYEVKAGRDCGDIGDCGYILMNAESFRAFHGGSGAIQSPCEPCPAAPPPGACEVIDLTGKRLLHERDLREHNVQNGSVVRVGKKSIITALAHDYAKGLGVTIERE